MGGKHTKFEGSYLPETPPQCRVSSQYPVFVQQPITVHTDYDGTEIIDPLDPRSPNGSRTPISILFTPPPMLPQDQTNDFIKQLQQTPVQSIENPLNILRKRFLKGFTYSVNDPRSPNMQLNRTPLIFEDANERTLNLDDTFSDLFVESRSEPQVEIIQKPSSLSVDSAATTCSQENLMQIDLAENEAKDAQTNNEPSVEITSFNIEDDETMPCPAKLHQTPIALQQQFDPRSPTIGVDRTPIIFSDDDEVYEDAMLENILATLSLDLSSSSSVVSFTQGTNLPSAKENIAGARPSNKHLDRVRLNDRMPNKQPKNTRRRQKIYEDSENKMVLDIPSPITPKKRSLDKNNGNSASKRTPLSCVKNRTHTRSRSVEASVKSQKARLSLTSYDDSLNPVRSSNVVGLRIMQGLEDSLEL